MIQLMGSFYVCMFAYTLWLEEDEISLPARVWMSGPARFWTSRYCWSELMLGGLGCFSVVVYI